MIQDIVGNLPAPRDLWECAVGLAVLDRLVDGQSFSMQMDEGNVAHFTYDHGSGDGLTILFPPNQGVLILGFDHESPVSPYRTGRHQPGLFDALPPPLMALVEGRALYDGDVFPGAEGTPLAGRSFPEATFCAWSDPRTKAWQCSSVKKPEGRLADDGASWLIECFGLDHWLEYHEQYDNEGIAEKFCNHRVVTDVDFHAIGPDADVSKIQELMRTLGYGQHPAWL